MKEFLNLIKECHGSGPETSYRTLNFDDLGSVVTIRGDRQEAPEGITPLDTVPRIFCDQEAQCGIAEVFATEGVTFYQKENGEYGFVHGDWVFSFTYHTAELSSLGTMISETLSDIEKATESGACGLRYEGMTVVVEYAVGNPYDYKGLKNLINKGLNATEAERLEVAQKITSSTREIAFIFLIEEEARKKFDLTPTIIDDAFCLVNEELFIVIHTDVDEGTAVTNIQ